MAVIRGRLPFLLHYRKGPFPVSQSTVLDAIPHRPPFLFIDDVTSITDDKIEAKVTLPVDLDVFRGHYPHFPIFPGVLTCEAVFQAGAILLSRRVTDPAAGVPALTRIRDARFKRMVRPGETLTLTAEIEEVLSSAFYMKGSAFVDGETAVRVLFTCALAPLPKERR
ncbi:MAG: beta-hydroxyacyl-ACP dehydratase [Nitrospinae bacterium]|nr:beta-hydroxyacyl-ACP dehydratase [Nitrospinota bacterium]